MNFISIITVSIIPAGSSEVGEGEGCEIDCDIDCGVGVEGGVVVGAMVVGGGVVASGSGKREV